MGAGRPKKDTTENNTNVSLTNVVSGALSKGKFDLEAFKKSKYLDKGVKFKDQIWIPLSKAFQEALTLPGIPIGHITVARGRSNTGKTTLMMETIASAQKMEILPVIIITEMKFSWEYARKMGVQFNEVIDQETGEVLDYEGNFIYVDRSSLNTIEDVAGFITDILNEQSKGKLPYNLLFVWDSVGSIPCQMSVEQGKNNPMWNAGAMATQFQNFVNQRFPLSRKITSPYTNTFFVINKVGVQPPESPMGRPRMTNKGGDSMYWDASLVITFGNITNSGTSKLKAVKNKKNVEFALVSKIAVDKNHINGFATQSTIVVTAHGFIENTDSSINNYKKTYSHEWFNELNPNEEIEVIQDNSEWEENKKGISIISAEE